MPRATEFTPRLFWQDLKKHVRLQIRPATGGPQYGLLQKCAYCAVILLALPLAVVTGLAMSPAITAAYPFLSSMFGGFQSARTVHFFAADVLVLFLAISEFPKWSKYLILLSFQDNSSARSVQIGGWM